MREREAYEVSWSVTDGEHSVRLVRGFFSSACRARPWLRLGLQLDGWLVWVSESTVALPVGRWALVPQVVKNKPTYLRWVPNQMYPKANAICTGTQCPPIWILCSHLNVCLDDFLQQRPSSRKIWPQCRVQIRALCWQRISVVMPCQQCSLELFSNQIARQDGCGLEFPVTFYVHRKYRIFLPANTWQYLSINTLF